MEKKSLTTKEVSSKLGISIQRVQQKVMKGHFPNSYFCECKISRMIPAADLINDIKRKNR